MLSLTQISGGQIIEEGSIAGKVPAKASPDGDEEALTIPMCAASAGNLNVLQEVIDAGKYGSAVLLSFSKAGLVATALLVL